MQHPPAPGMDHNRAEPIRLRTLMLLRWAAVLGQLASVVVALWLGLGFALGPVLALIAALVASNLWLMRHSPMQLSPRQAAGQLAFDLLQLSLLLGLTGGLTNPFALLMLAPVTIAATTLTARQTVALGVATVALMTLAAVFAQPLIAPDGSVLQMDPLLMLGHWAALVIGVAFFATYAHRVTAELQATNSALFATQMALLREQRLQHLGGVIAAAAHEMGTPLATIKLIAAELADELQDRPDLRDDANALRDCAMRCAEILRNMGQAGKDDLHLRATPLRAVIDDAASPHAGRGVAIHIDAAGPIIRRDPGVIHALRNLIQNAVDFAATRVDVVAETGDLLRVTISDDGPGYPPAILARLGDPYLRQRSTPRRGGYEGMGLGLFIAKTLLERSGAQVDFANGATGAKVRVTWPIDRIAADDRQALPENPASLTLY
ncbi:ActS/PrrB/RegB family redox-sensitive histidine kinase [Paracoccus sp. (in: a-proteobacteria)]|uniref:ActS/PrrB/RegB family redox-sensitive histidine kinase n=1 Tax=Paracoccus sp. TaxID=267 RepID=UPI0026DFEB59|nr:ActS/PrrB/RegB family redox-sensitive histidine kinase [Paracoccus sp. (in: a-proteobacteria)]MDO5648338.1 ActS/PrrB/RegB family redox-sensitive histidine kinase [Paracoccus sp. (in: a-proteobacteria)]